MYDQQLKVPQSAQKFKTNLPCSSIGSLLAYVAVAANITHSEYSSHTQWYILQRCTCRCTIRLQHQIIQNPYILLNICPIISSMVHILILLLSSLLTFKQVSTHTMELLNIHTECRELEKHNLDIKQRLPPRRPCRRNFKCMDQ
jgi:hypothetical protein